MSEEVKVGLQFTRNLQNYENVKVTIERTSDLLPDETFEQAEERVFTSVDEALSKRIAQIDKDAGNR